jgi:hypothetical protein
VGIVVALAAMQVAAVLLHRRTPSFENAAVALLPAIA